MKKVKNLESLKQNLFNAPAFSDVLGGASCKGIPKFQSKEAKDIHKGDKNYVLDTFTAKV